jgi:hypothetical protein
MIDQTKEGPKQISGPREITLKDNNRQTPFEYKNKWQGKTDENNTQKRPYYNNYNNGYRRGYSGYTGYSGYSGYRKPYYNNYYNKGYRGYNRGYSRGYRNNYRGGYNNYYGRKGYNNGMTSNTGDTNAPKDYRCPSCKNLHKVSTFCPNTGSMVIDNNQLALNYQGSRSDLPVRALQPSI